MAADRQRKVKLLAIEEEIARLEVEMLMQMKSSDRYLGPLFLDTKKAISRFFDTYLTPTLQTIKLHDISLDESIDTVCKDFLSREYTLYGSRLVPSAIWTGVVGSHDVYIFFLASSNKGKWFVFRASDIGRINLKESEFTVIWDGDSVESKVVLLPKQKALGKAIQTAGELDVWWPESTVAGSVPGNQASVKPVPASAVVPRPRVPVPVPRPAAAVRPRPAQVPAAKAATVSVPTTAPGSAVGPGNGAANSGLARLVNDMKNVTK